MGYIYNGLHLYITLYVIFLSPSLVKLYFDKRVFHPNDFIVMHRCAQLIILNHQVLHKYILLLNS